jgi:hypothetical protein
MRLVFYMINHNNTPNYTIDQRPSNRIMILTRLVFRLSDDDFRVRFMRLVLNHGFDDEAAVNAGLQNI